jgi:hypothetical protein
MSERQALNKLKGAAATTRGSVSVPGSTIGANSCTDIALTIRGTMPGDSVRLEPPASLTAGLFKSHEVVTGTGAVTLRICNTTGGGVALVTADWKFTVSRPL